MGTKQTPTSRALPLPSSNVAVAAAATGTGPLPRTPVFGQGQAPSLDVAGANDRIAVGLIGLDPWCNGGLRHLYGLHSSAAEHNTVMAAVCDPSSKYRNTAKALASLNEADVFEDHRKLLERRDIDAVLIAMHDPWHAQMTIDAVEAGKHVYCERPLTRYLDEAFEVYEAVKRSAKVFQIGVPGCSAGGYHKCAELIKAGKIGTPIWAQAWYSRNSIRGEWNYDIDPNSTAETVDWERWLGRVKRRVPFSAEHFRRWRKYYPYSAGPLAELASFQLHPLMLATGHPEFPVRVCSIGTQPVHVDKANAGFPEREVPELSHVLAEFPSGFVIMVNCCTVNGSTPGMSFYAHKASLNIDAGGGRVELTPQREFADVVDPETFANLPPVDAGVHLKNWFDCIRSGKEPNGNIELAIRVQTVLALAEMSDRLKITCLFDEKTRKITDGSGKEIPPITYGTLPLS